MSRNDRIVVTGMSINTPLADTLDGFLAGLLAGRSAISRWKTLDVSRCYSKIGADLSDYDVKAKLDALEATLDPSVFKRARKLILKAPWTIKLSVLLAIDAFIDGAVIGSGVDLTRVAGVIAGHNINCKHHYDNRLQYEEEPDHIDPLLALTGLDTDHAGSVSEALGIRGPIYTVGAACASANTALRAAIDEIRYHDMDMALVTAAVLDFSPLELQAMCIVGATTFQSFNDEPEKGSRPWDVRREGFVPAHGGAALLVEKSRFGKTTWRPHPRRDSRHRGQFGRQSSSQSFRRGAVGAHDAGFGKMRFGAGRRRLYQCACHVHAARRFDGNQIDQARVRRARL